MFETTCCQRQQNGAHRAYLCMLSNQSEISKNESQKIAVSKWARAQQLSTAKCIHPCIVAKVVGAVILVALYDVLRHGTFGRSPMLCARSLHPRCFLFARAFLAGLQNFGDFSEFLCCSNVRWCCCHHPNALWHSAMWSICAPHSKLSAMINSLCCNT